MTRHAKQRCDKATVSFQKSNIKLAKQLSDIVIYCKSVHFSGFEHAKDSHAFYEMSSFKESKAFNLAETSGKQRTSLTNTFHVRKKSQIVLKHCCIFIATAYIHHNMDKLSRIYPAGSRTDSSNYNPVPMWNVGCQIGTYSTRSDLRLSIRRVIVMTNVTFSLASLSDLVFSGAELPDSLQGDAPKPGSVPAQWCLWLHPETRIYEKPVLSV